MSEIPQPENNGEGFSLNIVRTPEVSDDPEIQAALDWYKESFSRLKPMVVEKGQPVTDGDKWKADINPDGQVEAIIGAHFKVTGRKITTPSFSWAQPVIEQSTQNGISGIVMLVRDEEGKLLISLTQEPEADEVRHNGEEFHPSLRTPTQTSVVKLEQLSQGREEVDPTLFKILGVLAQNGRGIDEVIRSIELRPAKTDPNRIDTKVVYGLIDVNKDIARELEESTGGKFLTRKQINAFDNVNGHTHTAISRTHNS